MKTVVLLYIVALVPSSFRAAEATSRPCEKTVTNNLNHWLYEVNWRPCSSDGLIDRGRVAANKGGRTA